MKFNPVFLAVASSTANSTAFQLTRSAVRAFALQNAATHKSRDTNCNHSHRSKLSIGDLAIPTSIHYGSSLSVMSLTLLSET